MNPPGPRNADAFERGISQTPRQSLPALLDSPFRRRARAVGHIGWRVNIGKKLEDVFQQLQTQYPPVVEERIAVFDPRFTVRTTMGRIGKLMRLEKIVETFLLEHGVDQQLGIALFAGNVVFRFLDERHPK